MERTWKTSSILLQIITGIMILFAIGLFFGVVVRGQLLPNMEFIIGMTTAEIRQTSPDLLMVMFVFLSVVSALLFALGVGMTMLIRGPFRRRDPEARRIVFMTLGLFLFFAEIISLSVFPYSPWPIWSLCLSLGVIAYVKSQPAADPQSLDADS